MKIEVIYTSPMTEATPRKSRTWYNLRRKFMAMGCDLAFSEEEVPLNIIKWNDNDGGAVRWGTASFNAEVLKLAQDIAKSGKFEAIWLKKENGVVSILDGHHRFDAWKKLGNSTIPAVVVTVTIVTTLYSPST